MNTHGEYEKRKHTSDRVSYAYYESKIPEKFISVPVHWHKEFEINRVINGGGIFRINKEEYLARKGDILIICPGDVHSAYLGGNDCFIYDTLVFNPSMIGASELSRSAVEYIQPLSNGKMTVCGMFSSGDLGYEKADRCTAQLFEFAKADLPENDLMVKAKLLELFYLLISNGHTKTETDSLTNSSVKPAISYISEHYAENISIGELALKCMMSESHFMALFKKTAGVSAVEYISELRLRQACYELKSTEKSVMEIAMNSGFRNLSNFNRRFKRTFGITPSEYRKKSIE